MTTIAGFTIYLVLMVLNPATGTVTATKEPIPTVEQCFSAGHLQVNKFREQGVAAKFMCAIGDK